MVNFVTFDRQPINSAWRRRTAFISVTLHIISIPTEVGTHSSGDIQLNTIAEFPEVQAINYRSQMEFKDCFATVSVSLMEYFNDINA